MRLKRRTPEVVVHSVDRAELVLLVHLLKVPCRDHGLIWGSIDEAMKAIDRERHVSTIRGGVVHCHPSLHWNLLCWYHSTTDDKLKLLLLDPYDSLHCSKHVAQRARFLSPDSTMTHTGVGQQSPKDCWSCGYRCFFALLMLIWRCTPVNSASFNKSLFSPLPKTKAGCSFIGYIQSVLFPLREHIPDVATPSASADLMSTFAKIPVLEPTISESLKCGTVPAYDVCNKKQRK